MINMDTKEGKIKTIFLTSTVDNPMSLFPMFKPNLNQFFFTIIAKVNNVLIVFFSISLIVNPNLYIKINDDGSKIETIL